MLIKHKHTRRFTEIFLIILLSHSSNTFCADVSRSAFGTTNFAFASYLGTGFYTTSGQEVYIVQLPFEHTIIEKTNTEAGWLLTLPLTIGVVDFDNIDIDNLPEFDDVTTLTFLPGIKYQYPATQNWTVTPFVDYGFARDINNTLNVLVTGVGIKSLYNIPINDALLSIGNRFLYARERSKTVSNDSDYSLIETGLNYRVTSRITHDDGAVFSNLYYIYFYYPNNLEFFERTTTPISVGTEHEVGITFSRIPGGLFFENAQIGIGVRFGDDVTAYRLIFGAPF